MITWAKIIAILVGIFIMVGIVIYCDTLIIREIKRFRETMEGILEQLIEFRRNLR